MRYRLTTLTISLAILAGIACQSETTGQGDPAADATTDPTNPTTDPTTEPTTQAVSAQRLYKAPTSGIQEARRTVISDPTAWAALWAEVVGTIAPQPDLPSVDFSGSVVIAVAMGAQNSGGHEISIDDVQRRGETLVVVVREVTPGPMCITTQVLTAPVDIVLIPKGDEPIEFEEEAETVSCT
jgi:hypothetical protein